MRCARGADITFHAKLFSVTQLLLIGVNNVA